MIADMKNEGVDIRHISSICNFCRLREPIWILDAVQILLLRQFEVLIPLPDINKDELEDKSNGDFLVKGLALIQVAWLITVRLSIFDID
jgi:hypothetical protein